MFLITDDSPLSDYEITPDDIVVHGVGNIEILSIYEPVIEYNEANKSYTYRNYTGNRSRINEIFSPSVFTTYNDVL